MKKQELISVLITFVVGFFAGGYLYLNYFVVMVQPDGVGTRDDQNAFTISSQAYGGCRSDCPAFRIESDGSYRYQFTENRGEEPIILSGNLPRSLQRDIRREISPAAIAPQTGLSGGFDCPSATDGIDLRFDITIDGTTYRLDSCQTNVNFSSDAWETLSSIWVYFNERS